MPTFLFIALFTYTQILHETQLLRLGSRNQLGVQRYASPVVSVFDPSSLNMPSAIFFLVDLQAAHVHELHVLHLGV